MTDDERPPAPEESLRLIEQQRSEVGRRLDGGYLPYYLPWGIAWLLSFGLLFLRYGPEGQVLLPMPGSLPFVVLAVTCVAAAGITAGLGARSARHIAGQSRTIGMMYGFSWPIAYAWMGVLFGRVSDHLPPEESRLLWPAGAIGVAGILYLAGGTIWQDRAMYGLGLWITLTNIVGVVVGPGWHSLVAALAGGGGLILAGLLFRGRTRPGPREGDRT